MDKRNVQEYLNRIDYHGEKTITASVLRQLQLQHLLTVPFENLDIHAHKKLDLDTEKFFQKIVLARRGGFCYELNGLFFELLKSLGFNAWMVSGRVYDPSKGFGPEFDHMAIVVQIDTDKYLVDVGFGEFSFYPLKIELQKTIADPRGKFLFQEHDKDYLRISKWVQDAWVPEYLFSSTKRELHEFKQMFEFHQTSPLSHFTQKVVCSIPTVQGRISITENKLKITEGEKITEEEIAGEMERLFYFLHYFGINER